MTRTPHAATSASPARPHGKAARFVVESRQPFTPGPWDYERRVDPRDVERPWIGRLNENRFSALACGETADEAWANARLIAAAPELLEALEELHLKAVIGTDDERHAALNKAWAAIFKARGES